ncbi:hypothetical protein GQ457_02G021170 [Hibiscus cannabinus]
MLLLLLSRGFDNLLELDDKGDVSTRDNGSGLGRFSRLIQISAERLAELLAYCSFALSIRMTFTLILNNILANKMQQYCEVALKQLRSRKAQKASRHNLGPDIFNHGRRT